MTPSTYDLLDAIADSYDPFLALLALFAPWLGRSKHDSKWRHYLTVILGLLFVYLLMGVDRWWHPRQRFGVGYSTHTAFAASLMAAISFFRPRWGVALILFFASYVVLELVMRYHGNGDIAVSTLLAAGSTWVTGRLLRVKG